MLAFLFGGVENKKFTDFVLTIVRVFAGCSLAFAHGLAKWPASEGFINHVTELGFPVPVFWAWAAIFGEAVASLLMAAGLFTRFSAFFMASTMFVAAVINHGTDPYGVAEKAYLYLSISLLFVFIGTGRFGLDAVIRKKINI